jgi:4-amino-4-deoxy-L-arabinose transferase-like glycosyltransferase
MFYVLERRHSDWPVALCATLIMALSPLFWLQSGLALTDMFGMVFVVGFLLVEGATTTAPRGALAKRIACGLIAGLSLGARPHITLLIVVYWCLRATWSRPIEVGHVLTAVLAFAVGIAAWLIPASIATGGPEIYWSARVRPARVLLHTRPLLRPGDGKPPADPVRDCGFTCRPGRLDN